MDGLIAYALSKKYTRDLISEMSTDGFDIQVEEDRSILSGVGEEKVMYFLPKTVAKPQDGYDEYIYVDSAWEQVGATDIDMSNYATKTEVGNLNSLMTENKSSLVAAINEIAGIPNADTMLFPTESEASSE